MVDLAFAVHAKTQSCAANRSFEDALHRMTQALAPLGTERIALAQAAGRVLAAPLLAHGDVPGIDLAAMDGYAVRDHPARTGTMLLPVVGQAAPGDPYLRPLEQGETVRIFTGAPVPDGTGRVIPQELVLRHGNQVAIPTNPGSSRHIRPRGSDFVAGAALLPAGRLLDSRAMLVAGAADVATLPVWRRPRLFVLATGDELRCPGSAAQNDHSVPDSVSLAVAALAETWGAEMIGATLVPDRIDAIEQAARTAIDGADILVMTGGASVGDRDFSKAALASLGLDIVFSKVAMKPGKPLWYGRVGATHILGLPGNPTAALVTARLFLAPLVCRLLGRTVASALPWRTVSLGAPLMRGGDREVFLCGVWDGEAACASDRQSASGQAGIANADILIRRGIDAPEQRCGDRVMILDF